MLKINELQQKAINKILDRVSEVEGKEIEHHIVEYTPGTLVLSVKVEGVFNSKYSINELGGSKKIE